MFHGNVQHLIKLLEQTCNLLSGILHTCVTIDWKIIIAATDAYVAPPPPYKDRFRGRYTPIFIAKHIYNMQTHAAVTKTTVFLGLRLK